MKMKLTNRIPAQEYMHRVGRSRRNPFEHWPADPVEAPWSKQTFKNR